MIYLVLVISMLQLLLPSCTVQSEVKCGERNVFQHELISHGNQVSLGKWPWHAGLFQVKNEYWLAYACGGTIISSSYILTAAHCTFTQTKVRALNSAEIVVRVGLTNLQLDESPSQKINVARIIRHLEYHTGSAENDIALLKLTSMLKMTDYVIPICLWKGSNLQSAIVGQNGSVVGWGKDENDKIPDQLKDAIMPIVSREDCRKSDENFYSRYLFNNNNFCAGFRNGTSAGLGDSGGGLHIHIDGKWMLRGIVSKGKFNVFKNLDTTSYIIFTDVAYYLNWIDQNMDIRNKASTEDYSVCGKITQSLSNNDVSIWPWQGQVFRRIRRRTQLCDAVIISDSFLLSPADVYAIEDVKNPSRLKVGFLNDQGALVRFIKKITRHEEFLQGYLKNNIAILEVTEKITYSRLIRPICLGKSQPTTKVSGSMNNVGQFQAPLLDYPLCKLFPAQPLILQEQLSCYKIEMPNRFKTPPDFVYYRKNESWYLRGIAINKTKSYYPNVLHVLTLDLTYFKDWIDENINLLGIHNCFWRNFEDWNLSIYNNNDHQCFASPISRSLLLTTAECIDGITLKSLSVVKENSEMESINIKKIHLHPSFDNETFTNNIAVLELEKPFGGIGICLPGLAEDLSNLQLRVPTLNEALPTIGFTRTDTEKCGSIFYVYTHIAAEGSHICGLMEPDIEEEFESECSKDFHGAPLLFAQKDSSNVYLRGILDIAKNNHCEDFDTPEVYLDVMHYADWISKIARESSRQ